MTQRSDSDYRALEDRCRQAESRVAELAAAEARATHVQQVLLGLRSANKRMLLDDEPERLMAKVCDALTASKAYPAAWAVLADGPGKPVQTCVASGLGERFALLQTGMKAGPMPACIERALAEDAVRVVDDPGAECANCALAPECTGPAVLLRRLDAGDRVYGVLCVFAPTAYAHDGEERQLFEEAAADLACALHRAGLTARLQRLEAMASKLPHPVAALSSDYRYITVNGACVQLHGVPREQIVGRRPSDFLGQDLFDREMRPHLERCLAGEPVQHRIQVHLPDAGMRWIELHYLPHMEASNGGARIIAHGADITERLERELQYEYILKTAMDGFWLITADGVLAEVNESGAAMLGYTPEEMVGRHISEVDVNEDPDAVRRHMARVKERGAERFSTQHRHKDGHRVEVEVGVSYLRESGGQLVAFTRDITPRLHAEEALRASEEKFSRAFENAPLLMTLSALEDGRYLEVNDAFVRSTGYSREQALGHTSVELGFITADARQKIVDALRLNGWVRDLDLELTCADGTRILCLYSGQIIRTDGTERLLSIAVDITERKQVERSLRESEERFRTVLEGLPAGVFAHGLDGRLRFVNDTASRNTGYAREELLGMTVADIDPSSVTRDDRRHLWEQLDKGQSIEVESEHVRKNGTRYPVQVHLSAVTLNGEPIILATAFDISERKRTEQALREASRNLEEAVTAGNVGLWDWDVATNKVRYSAQWKAQLGFEAEEIGEDFEEWQGRVHPDDLEPTMREIQQMLCQCAPRYSVEFRMRHKDGSYRWILAQASAYYNEEGAPLRVRGSHVDITGRRLAEQAVRESEERFKAIIQSVNDGLVYADRRGTILHVNEALGRITGIPASELIGKNSVAVARKFVSVKQLPGLLSKVYTVLKGASLGPFQLELHNKTLEISAHYTKHTRKITGVVRDVTGRLEAERALRESERQKKLILNATAEMVAYYDLDLRVVWANQAAGASVGCTPAELAGRHCYEIWSQRHEPCEDCPVLRARESGAPCDSERQTPDGRWWRLRGYPVFDDQRQLIALVEFGQDITENRRVEQEHMRLEEQYRQAQKMEAIGQLTGGVAHDFNNILQVINGAADMALEDLGPGHPVRPILLEVAHAGARASRLVSQLLLFSRRQVMRPEHLDLNETVAEMLKLLGRVLGEQVQLQWHPGKAGTIHGDRGMVEQALMNLCVNARDAMPAGGTLTITTGILDADAAFCEQYALHFPGRYVRLTVTDTGCGMNAETLSHVFEPFYTTKQPGQGTGLGLATVYGIIKQHDGAVNVQSEPDAGTTFNLYWPESGVQLVGEAEERAPTPLAGTGTILLAEDEASVRRFATLFLERSGYRVLTAENGAEAVALFQEQAEEIDLVILDVVMPVLGGRAAYEQMRAIRPELKALFTSGYSEDAIHKGFVLEEGLTLIQKPFRREEFLTVVHGLLGLDKP